MALDLRKELLSKEQTLEDWVTVFDHVDTVYSKSPNPVTIKDLLLETHDEKQDALS